MTSLTVTVGERNSYDMDIVDEQPVVGYSRPGNAGPLVGCGGSRGEPAPPALRDRNRFLAESGVSLIAIPCNSAHVWFDELQEAASVKILHIAYAALDAFVGIELST